MLNTLYLDSNNVIKYHNVLYPLTGAYFITLLGVEYER